MHSGEREREAAFYEFFVARHLWLMQAFLLGGALLSTFSIVWYEAIDPAHAPEAQKIKFLVLPFLLGVQAVLLPPGAMPRG